MAQAGLAPTTYRRARQPIGDDTKLIDLLDRLEWVHHRNGRMAEDDPALRDGLMEQTRLERAMIREPARTVEGLRAKARAITTIVYTDRPDFLDIDDVARALAQSIVENLLAVGVN